MYVVVLSGAILSENSKRSTSDFEVSGVDSHSIMTLLGVDL